MDGLILGMDNEIVQLSKYSKGWNEMFKELELEPQYRTTENFEMYCYLRYMGCDAKAMFYEKIKLCTKDIKK